MAENVTNELLLEHMKKMQTELVAARERDAELLRRITIMEIAMTDLLRHHNQTMTDQVGDRHALDAIRSRVERIERSLSLSDG